MKYLIKIRNKFNKALAPIFMFLFRCVPIKNNKIIIYCHNGKGYGDNCKYIAEELKKEKNNYDIVWAIKKGEEVPSFIRTVKINSLKSLYELATAKIWINNLRFMPYIKKRKNQFYIQTWHSSLRLKKIELDAPEVLTRYYLKQIKNDSKMIDMMISGCDFSYETYRRAFMYDGKIEKVGTPRCDIFFNNTRKDSIKKQIFELYKLNPNKKTILYAPTFRDNVSCNDVYINLEELVNQIDDTYQVLVRMHPNKRTDFKFNSNKVIDVTQYPDMQELLCMVDILITDYSGCCFDMMIAGGTCILFLKDLKDYLSKERDVYFDISKLPFIKAYNESELVEIIKNKKYNNANDEIEKFKEKIGLYEDGLASYRIKNIIDKVIEGEKNE